MRKARNIDVHTLFFFIYVGILLVDVPCIKQQT